jgi:hypothetical protein
MPELLGSVAGAEEPQPLAHLVYVAELRLRKERPTRGAVADEPDSGVPAQARTSWEENSLSAEGELADRVYDAAVAFFGPRVRVDTTIAPGQSLEVGIVLVALGAIGQYRAHIENVAWFANHVKTIIRRVLSVYSAPNQRVVVRDVQLSVTDAPPEPSQPAQPSSAAQAPEASFVWLARILRAILVAVLALVGLVTALLVIALLD